LHAVSSGAFGVVDDDASDAAARRPWLGFELFEAGPGRDAGVGDVGAHEDSATNAATIRGRARQSIMARE
jgi:hypothetical protein